MKRVFLMAVAFACAISAGAFELREGRIKLVINERTARFSLYYLADVAKNQYVPLVYDQEPRTSFPTLSIDGKTHRLGDSAEYRFTVGKGEREAFIEYRSSFCAVRQTFSFIASTGSDMVDGVAIRIEIENVSDRDITVGVRYLLDTWLGEKSGRHFSIGNKEKLATEYGLSGAFVERKFTSPSDSTAALACMLSGEGVTKPDKVQFANWKRLYDGGWAIEISGTRDFNLYPYSVNDSAVALFYEPALLRKGAIRSITMLMGNDTEAGFAIKRTDTKTPETTEPSVPSTVTAPAASGTDKVVAAKTDIVAIRELIEKIDTALASGATPGEIAEYRTVLERLLKRRESF